MYCSVQDIEAYYNNVKFDCNGYVDGDECNSFISQDTALINAYIKKKYSLPITDASDLLILQMICEMLVVGKIDDIIREKDPSETLERDRNYRKNGLKMIQEILKGDLILDGTKKTSVIKFNNIDSEGNTVNKLYKIEDATQ